MMKAIKKIHTGDPNCSCASCVYKNPPDNPSLGHVIAQGTRIDRLFYGKYIPLRERKLLDKLVRTRAVYDDLRAKLISDSTTNFNAKTNSKTKNKLSPKELDDAEKGSAAIFEIVDMVDKSGTKGLSECCSCCSCSSKGNLQQHRRPKHHRSNFGARGQIFQKKELNAHPIKKGVRFKAKHIKSDPCACTFKFSGLLKSKKTIPMEHLDLQITENRQPEQNRAREFARMSYEILKQSNKQIGEKVLEGIKKIKESKTNIQERLQFDAQASAIKLKQSNKLKSKVKTAPQKRLSNANLQLNDLLAICMCPEDEIFKAPSKESVLDIIKQKSKEQIIEAKNKLKSAMKSTMERKPKITKIKTKTSGTGFAPENDIAFQVKKDSIRKFQEELRRKQIMKDWLCHPECIENTCVPEECLIKVKNKGKTMKHRGLEHNIRKQEKKTGGVLIQKNEKIQNKALTVQAKKKLIQNNEKIQNKALTVQAQKKLIQNNDKIQNKALTVQAKKKSQKQTLKTKDTESVPKQKVVIPQQKSSSGQGVRIKSSFSFEVEFFKQKPKMTLKESAIEKPTPSGINYKIKKNSEVYSRQRNSQVVVKRSSRNTQTEIRSLKRCFCTLKLKSKKSKLKHKKKHKVKTAEKSITTLESSTAPCKRVDCSVELCNKLVCDKLMVNKLSNAKTNTTNKSKKKRDVKPRQLLPYECEPGVCTPGNCDPYQCIKLINVRETKVKECSANCFSPSRKTKSTSTFTSRSNKASKAKIAQSLYTYSTQKRNEGRPKIERKYVHNAYGRQAVKIGSTFSFNIEFYKNKHPQHYTQPSDLKSFVVKPKLIAVSKPKLKERAYQGDVPSIHKNIPTQIYKKKRDESLSTSLKKCFCTLKLQRKSHSKFKRKKMFSTGTKTIEEPFMDIVTSTKGTKTKQKHLKSLKPYECEPFTCIPGECNPYECLERINKRNLRDVGVSSKFNRSEINKGSSTSEKTLKAVKTQSKPRSREQKVLTKIKKLKTRTQTFKEKISYTPSAPSKQAVTIGSTFSFNIEFYKKQQPMKDLQTNYQIRPTVKLDTRPITKNRGVKIEKFNVANLDTQVEEMKKRNKTSTTKPLLKRCFCTLNLQKTKNNSRTKPFKSSVMESKVYTVNRALMKQNRLSIFRTHCTKHICSSRSAKSYMNSSLNGQLSDCVIKSLYSECRRLNSIKHLQCQRSYPLNTNIDKLETIKSNFNTALKLISQSYISDNLKLNEIGNSQLVKGSNNVNEYSSHINQEGKCVDYNSNNFQGENGHLSGLRQYLKGYYCTMNLQVVRNKNTGTQKVINSAIENKSRKLKPYECEPGVCIPGECNPYECLKLISKRNSNFSKKTGTETVTTTSSYTSRSALLQITENKTKASQLSPTTKPSKSYLSKNTGMNKQNFRNQLSQSAFNKTLQKASATLPRMKRCFCTLKLQKRGRLYKEEHKHPSQALQTEPPATTIDRGQKAPKFKPIKMLSLEPYECQPGICIPDQCNPYECLEIMKRLHYNQKADSGTDAIKEESKSSASMAVSELRHKTRKTNVKPKVTSKSNLSEGKQKSRVQPTKVVDQISGSKKHHKKTKERLSETSTAMRDQKSQNKSTAQATSTMTTSFMKRCFCVLKLRKNKKKQIDETTEVKNINKPVSVDKKTNTKHYKERMLQLDPYECEPGICIPGECDPYVCEKIIKRRNNLRSQSSSTAFNSARSVTSSSSSSVTKNINTQLRPITTARETQKKVFTKTKVRDSRRQAVKIESNFSFDIEFYKNKKSKFKDYDIPGDKKKESLKPKQKKQKSLGTKTPPVSFRSQISEIKVNKKDFAAGINNVIKRCFCTLQLYNQRKSKEKKQKPIKKKVHSKSVMTIERNKINLDTLEPYECEPNICIPYECDPYECEKLIKLRQRKQHQRKIGISTQHSSKQIEANAIEPFKTSQKRTQSVSTKNKEHDVKIDKNAGVQLEQKPHSIQTKLATSDKVSKRIKTKSQGLQSQKPIHTSPSQIENEMKTRSTMARSTPSLKRCFCTFYLNRPKKETVSIPKPIMSSVATETILRGPIEQPVTKLLPYECEPNICIPGECNPVECLERIKVRLKNQKNYGTLTQHLQKNEFGSSMDTTKTSNRRSQFKSLGHVKQVQHKQLSTNNRNKQTGLGHFDVNVSDEHKPKYASKSLNTTSYDKQVNKKLNRGNQSHYSKQNADSSTEEPFLKRCFCTLKLQKKPATKVLKTNVKSNTKITQISQPKKVSKDRGTLTKKFKENKLALLPYECEPNTCIPGQCDPYACQKRIEARYFRSKNISTQMLKQFSPKSVGKNLANTDSKKIQSNLISNISKKTEVHKPTNIVELPRFGNIFNKQAVKIGSNFSFNIEFYKEILPPTAERYPKYNELERYGDTRLKKLKKSKKPKIITDSIKTSTLDKHHNKGSQGYGVTTDDKALEVGNALKRCFCTLKLQKELNSKQSKLKIQNPQYPQVIEVRRVSVEKNTQQTLTKVKSIGTKTKTKYTNASCDPSTCQVLKNLSSQELEVILPYAPSKFNKTPSKTMQNKELQKETDTKPRITKITNRGKRLTKKHSKKSIHTTRLYDTDMNPTNHSISNFKSFMCKCAQLFMKRTEPENLNYTTVKELNNENENESSKHKKKRNKPSLGGGKTTKTVRRSHRDSIQKKNESDIAQTHPMSLKSIKKHQMDNSPDVITHKKQSMAKESGHQKDHEKTKQFQENSRFETEDFFCSHCINNTKMKKRHSQPLKVHFLDTPINKNKGMGKKTKAKDGLALFNRSVDQIDKHRKSIQNNKNKTDIQTTKIANYCKYCVTCGAKLNNEEIQKAAGDQRSLKSQPKEKLSPKGKEDPNQHQQVKGNNSQRQQVDSKNSQRQQASSNNSQHQQVSSSNNQHQKVSNKNNERQQINSKNTQRQQINSKNTQRQQINSKNTQRQQINSKNSQDQQVKQEQSGSTCDKIKNLFRFIQSDDNICSAKGPDPPLFEMHLDSDDYSILNKDEVVYKVKRLRKKSVKDRPKDQYRKKLHGKSCRCCICLAKKNKAGASFNVTPKGSKKKAGGNIGKLFGGTPSRPIKNPCVCGSKICAKQLKNIGKDPYSLKPKRKKRCKCGSPICGSEIKTIKAIAGGKDNFTCMCAIEKAKMLKKIHAQAEAEELKRRAKRIQQFHKEDKIRSAERRKRNDIMEKKVNKTSSDLILAAESLIDIGKLGITACTDILRLVARTATDPKHAYRSLKEMKENPELLYKSFASGLSDSNLASTYRRIRLRCLSMKGIKTIKSTLEGYAFTNYVLYMFHKDPKKRLLKRKPRQREQIDFDCSLYMGSLRKRPHLSVYNKCPWFYPHFMSLLNVWRQFMDVSLFLLAVLVWSPCIFCMEACRAFMCCFLCTG